MTKEIITLTNSLVMNSIFIINNQELTVSKFSAGLLQRAREGKV